MTAPIRARPARSWCTTCRRTCAGALSFEGGTVNLGSPTGVFTDVQGVVTARFAVPTGYMYEGDAMLKTPLSPILVPAVAARLETNGKTLALDFNRADLDNNVPAGASVPLVLSGHFRQNGAQKQLTSTVNAGEWWDSGMERPGFSPAVHRAGSQGLPRVAKLQIDAAVVFDALGVLEIHVHPLRGFDHEVHARPDDGIGAAVERDRLLAV